MRASSSIRRCAHAARRAGLARPDLRAAVCKRHRSLASCEAGQHQSSVRRGSLHRRRRAARARVRRVCTRRRRTNGWVACADGLHARGARPLERRDRGARRRAPALAGDDGIDSRSTPCVCAGCRPATAMRRARISLRSRQCCDYYCRCCRVRACSPASTWRITTSARGELDAAVKELEQHPDAGTSHSPARRGLRRRLARARRAALALPMDQGIDADSVWTALGLALRERRSPAPYLAAIREYKIDDAQQILDFITAARTSTNPARQSNCSTVWTSSCAATPTARRS